MTSIPAPVIDDLLVCEGGVTAISIPAAADRIEVLYEQKFDGHKGFIIQSRCSGSSETTCYQDNSALFADRGLSLDAGTDFF